MATKKTVAGKTTPGTSKVPRAAKAVAPADRHRYCAQPPARVREFAPGVSATRAFSIVTESKKWVNGTQLTYYCFKAGDSVPSFWHGNAKDIQEVNDAFVKWAALGIGISFKAVDRAEDAAVRIGFDASDGSWSYVGRDVIGRRDPAERTMNFGWPLNTPYGRDTALHEIGHTLGLEHEHQNPFAGIEWDEPAVKTYFRGAPNNWSDDQIEQNILRKIPKSAVKGTTWDPNSVMEYQFEAGLILAPAPYASGLKPAGGLSALDKSWVRSSYPVASTAPAQLQVAASQLLALARGETRTFEFIPDRTRTYEVGTFGNSDTLVVLFEIMDSGSLQIAGDDDSGEDRNAKLSMRLTAGRKYQIGVRLYYADAAAETALMVW